MLKKNNQVKIRKNKIFDRTSNKKSINVKSLRNMNEAEITDKITTLFAKYSITPYQQYQTSVGPCDLYVFDKRIIIEVKKMNRLDKGPNHPDSGDGGRTAFQQLDGYIKAERSRNQKTLLEFENEISAQDGKWIGIVTNFEKWWVWTWTVTESKDDGTLQENFNGIVLDNLKERQLMSILQRTENTQVPKDPIPIFEPYLLKLTELYNKVKDIRSTKTQKGLWLQQLEAGGNSPKDDIDDVFIRHTLLILITRLISQTVGIVKNTTSVTEGFVRWVPESELNSLKADIENYDWRYDTRDILRSLYMGFIPKKHRKVYGEYYTPDWLAEKLARTVIDEQYIKKQLDLFQEDKIVHGVLDPACGSGSLLYHAGRVIINSKTLQEAREYMDQSEIDDFLCAMLYGIDIHPVAVEMTRTNMRRLLISAKDHKIQIYQGDSLLLKRPTNTLHSVVGDNDMVLYSPNGTPLTLPRIFLKDSKNIERFVRTAKNNKMFPKSIIASLGKNDINKIKIAHDTLINIIKNEGNGVWEWYIKNQAAPLLLQENKAGRIISNPPWVRINHIQVNSRNILIQSEARQRGLWVGGNTATNFDIAALFVDKCSSLYLTHPEKSGWLLMGGALKGTGWRDTRASKTWKSFTAMWDLGNIAFPMGFSTCAVFFGIKTPSKRLVKLDSAAIQPTDFLSDLDDKVKWLPPNKTYEKQRSGYMAHATKKSKARNGATLFPYNLIRINTHKKNKNRVEFETTLSTGKWEKYGVQNGVVPIGWIKNCIYTQNLYPYILKTSTSCIIPLKGNKWDPKRENNEYWSRVSDIYAGNIGNGKTTPKTLENCLNYNEKLFKQFKKSGWSIVYNAGGDTLYAMKIKHDEYIIEHGLFYISCESEAEADFLSAMLNASIMLPAINDAKTSATYFGAKIWENVPIPKFNKNDKLHKQLVKVSRRACKVADITYENNLNDFKKNDWKNWKMGKIIRKALIEHGIDGEVNDLCRQILPNHTD